MDRFSGINLTASFEFTDAIYVSTSYCKHSDHTNDLCEQGDGTYSERLETSSEVDLSEFTLGLGYKVTISDSSVIATDINYLKVTTGLSSEGRFNSTLDVAVVTSEEFSSSNSEREKGILLRSVYHNLFENGFQVNLGLQ
jgi:hypothetical protein